MESLYKRRVYQSMRKKKAAASKKKPQIGLSARLLDDSDEESCASTTTSESEYENEDSTGTERTPDSDEEQSSSGGDGSESSGKRTVSQARRKRSTLPDSSSDSDSDVGSNPKRKVIPRKRIKVESPASDSDAEDSKPKEKRIAEAKETVAKRKQRQNKLLALSKKMKSRIANRRCRRKDSGDEEEAEGGSDKEDVEDKEDKDGDNNGDSGDGEDDDDPTADPLIASSQEELKDSDSLHDFIVEEEKGGESEEELDPQQKAVLSLPREFITGSQLTHFQVVVKALLINVLDETFLKSLYSGERNKRYAQEMKTSLFHFDERTVLPRLENLKQRSRWSSRYKERVECYPKVRVLRLGLHGSVCEACQLQRQITFTVKLSGQLYDNNTLQEDHFMPNDTQAFNVGSVCASRTEVYHILKHFKYHLFQHCRTVLEEEKKNGEEEEAVKDTVNRVFVKLQDGGWISEQYEKFQDHLNNADYFQEEKLD